MKGSLNTGRWVVLAAALSVAGAALAPAEPAASATNSTTITSKRLTFDYQSRYAVFEEDVLVKDPAVRIQADKLTAVFEKDNNPKVIVAMGHVRIEQDDRRAVCERAVYEVKSGRLELTGNPVIRRGTEYLKGTTIVFWRNDNRVEGKDVQMVIDTGGDSNANLKKMLGD